MKKRVLASLVLTFVGFATATPSGHMIEPASGPIEVSPGTIGMDGPEGSILWEQPPDGRSSVSAQDDGCLPFLAESADDFVGNGEQVAEVGWWGAYWDTTSRVPDSIRINIFSADADGLPGELLYSFETADYIETPGDPNRYRVVLGYRFSTVADTRYSISITVTFCSPPQWGWATAESSPDGINTTWFRSDFFGYPDWTPAMSVFGVHYDQAFVLYGVDETPVTEVTWARIKAGYH
jgi:hypothetical protein